MTYSIPIELLKIKEMLVKAFQLSNRILYSNSIERKQFLEEIEELVKILPCENIAYNVLHTESHYYIPLCIAQEYMVALDSLSISLRNDKKDIDNRLKYLQETHDSYNDWKFKNLYN